MIVAVEDTAEVYHNEISNAQPEQELADSDTRRACAVDNYSDVLKFLSCELYGVEHSRADNYRGTVLVVVEYRNIQLFLELCFDLKAAGSGDILKIDAAEAVGDKLNGAYDLIGILALYAERERVHSAEFLEQTALALHNGHACESAYVAETEHSGAVGDDCNEVAAAGEFVGKLRILCNLKAGLCNAGSVRKGEILAGVDGSAGDDLQLSAPFVVLL